VGVVVYCFLVSFVLFLTRSLASRVLLGVCAATLLYSAAPRVQYLSDQLATNGEPTRIQAAIYMSAFIDQLPARQPITTEWCAHVAALEYLARSPSRFQGFDENKATSARYLVIDETYLVKNNAKFVDLFQRCETEIARVRPYTLRECK
jgi:hypothetical protein